MSDAAPELDEIVLAALFAADHPLQTEEIAALFELGDGVPRPEAADVEAAIERAGRRLDGLPVAILRVASGYRIEVSADYSPWVSRLWVERPARYSRALLETLALIAYRQPITRPEIEAVRGVAVNTNIIRALSERGWIRVVGHRDAPGRPALYGTTRVFLDYFGLASLDELPTLAEIRELSDYEPELPLGDTGAETGNARAAAEPAAPDAEGEADGGEVVRGPWTQDGGDGS